MDIFRSFLGFEFRRFFKRRLTLSAAILILVLSAAVTQVAVNDYKDKLDSLEQFRETERFKVTQYTNYTQYGGYGYRTLFIPNPLSILFMDSGIIPEMTSFVDSGERLRIYMALKGSNIFRTRRSGFADLSGILLFLGSLLSAFMGFNAFANVEFLKMLTSLTSSRETFIYLMAVRFFLLALLFLGVLACGVLVIGLNGIILPIGPHFAIYAGSMLLMTMFFFTLGAVCGGFKSRKSGGFMLVTVWFLLVLVAPSMVNYYVAYRSKLIKPLHRMEMEKLKLVMDFEKRAIEQKVTFQYGEKLTDPVKIMVLSYFNNEFKKIQEIEKGMLNQMRQYILLQHRISSLFPTIFYISTISELSSRGFGNILDYYRFVQESKRDFFKFYMDRMYFSIPPMKNEVKAFIKDDDNIFFSVPMLPEHFIPALLLNILFALLLFLRTYANYRQRIFTPGSLSLTLENGTFTVLDSGENKFRDTLFSLLSDHSNETGKIKPTFSDFSGSFVYICHPREFPDDVRAGDMAQFLVQLMEKTGESKARQRLSSNIREIAGKPVAKLYKEDKGKIILEIMGVEPTGLYIVDDAAGSMSIGFAVQLKDRMEELAEDGSTVVYFTSNPVFTAGPTTDSPVVFDTRQWCMLVDRYRELYDIQPKKTASDSQ